jgi:hypothetical protein
MSEDKIEHLKGLCVINITKHLMQRLNLNHEEAYKKILSSETYRILMQTDSSLFLEDDNYLCKAIDTEIDSGKEKLYDMISE